MLFLFVLFSFPRLLFSFFLGRGRRRGEKSASIRVNYARGEINVAAERRRRGDKRSPELTSMVSRNETAGI